MLLPTNGEFEQPCQAVEMLTQKWLFIVLVAAFEGGDCTQQTTRTESRLLSRKKRYLTFPKGSNFIISMSGVKSVMVQQPRGVNILGEVDVPFSLPSDTRWFSTHKRVHERQRRDIFNQLSTALEGYGYNGTACMNRMICDFENLFPNEETSMLKDMLSVLFRNVDAMDHKYRNYCNYYNYEHCDISFLGYLTSNFHEFEE